jgi:hypothetical protein
MGRIFGWILIVATLYVGMRIYTEGVESTFGSLFEPITPISQSETPDATGLTPAAQEAYEPSSPAPHRQAKGQRHVTRTEAVRHRVTSSLEQGARRRGY